MAEATMENLSATEIAELRDAARAFDLARMKKVGGVHFAMVIAALTVWGAALTWSESTGWVLAEFAALGGALVAGSIIPSTLHEWGHLLGARLSGATSPVHDDPPGHFVVFDYKMDQNDVRQFGWMSWGGIIAAGLPALLGLFLVPLSLTSGALFFSVLVSKAVATAAFEVPIAQAAADHGEPGRALSESVKGGGLTRGRRIGLAAGVACFLLLQISN
ncbi:MAG: hypothetical protein AB8G23_12670 [Myxococcota bacterium]